MAEWDRLVKHCSNDLPVFASEKLIDGSDELCFCCTDLASMEVIHLPCCKASVHRQCVFDALQSNNQCVLEEIARACTNTRIRPSLTLVLTGPRGRIGGLGVTAFY